MLRSLIDRFVFPKHRLLLTGKMTPKHMEAHHSRVKVVWTCFFYFLINLILFLVLWIVAWANTGGDLNLTFSEMLTMNSDIRELYTAWWVFFLMTDLHLMLFTVQFESVSLLDNESDPVKHDISFCINDSKESRLRIFRAYLFFTALYLGSTIFKQIGLLFLFIFQDTGFMVTEHRTWAGIAFSAAIISFISNSMRRVLSRVKPWINDSTIVITIMSFVFSVVMISLAITFIFESNGKVEFSLSLFIVLARAFQVYDFRNSTICYSTLHNDTLDISGVFDNDVGNEEEALGEIEPIVKHSFITPAFRGMPLPKSGNEV